MMTANVAGKTSVRLWGQWVALTAEKRSRNKAHLLLALAAAIVIAHAAVHSHRSRSAAASATFATLVAFESTKPGFHWVGLTAADFSFQINHWLRLRWCTGINLKFKLLLTSRAQIPITVITAKSTNLVAAVWAGVAFVLRIRSWHQRMTVGALGRRLRDIEFCSARHAQVIVALFTTLEVVGRKLAFVALRRVALVQPERMAITAIRHLHTWVGFTGPRTQLQLLRRWFWEVAELHATMTNDPVTLFTFQRVHVVLTTADIAQLIPILHLAQRMSFRTQRRRWNHPLLCLALAAEIEVAPGTP